ncbi:sensor histidine kinase [Inquilinus sp.]|jgi:signal transduction histidine kinase|uniref:sensor histidine kinase n=1 Tax=Inquilinus sp. TaxID=1932117 RepID=UPI003784384B
MNTRSRSAVGASPGQLERELAYYQRECNDLGARLLRLQEEQSQAFREARRSRTLTKLIREAHRLADTVIGPADLGDTILEIVVDNAMCDRAALLVEEAPGSRVFRVTHAIGLREKAPSPIMLPSVPDFFFTTAQTRIEPPAYELTGILQLPYVLWAYDRTTGYALMIGNRSEANVNRAFEAGDQELIEGGLSVYIDVLARKQAEHELRRAMRAAEQADEAKATFLATLSHELRTPLNSIIGLADIMSSKRPSALTVQRSGTYAAEIAGSGRHLLRLINDILDYSGIARGHLAIQPEWIRLEHSVGAAIRAAQGMAEQRGVTLSMSPVDSAVGILVDSLRFRQILDNLIGNAIKFTPQDGKVIIDVEIGADKSIEILVKDTGIGMRPEDIAIAMEPFRQLDNALTRKTAGTGLGLPITKGLVEAHGGSLAIESEPGRGTIVRVMFPAALGTPGRTGNPATKR